MKKIIFLLILLATAGLPGRAQVKWSDQTLSANNIAWDNYSTTYWGDFEKGSPFLVTAIPYNGMYNVFSDGNSDFDKTFSGSNFRFKGAMKGHSAKLFTYDSSDVYFLAPGIYRKNAGLYEYQVSNSDGTLLKDWSPVTEFSDISLQHFEPGFAFLGGFRASWGKAILISLRKKNGEVISSSIVSWKEIKPALSGIYTNENLDAFFAQSRQPWNRPLSDKTIPTVSDSLKLTPADNNIIFELTADIYKRSAVEYQLEKDGKIIRPWGPNDYDQGYIWLKNLKHGQYILSIRYARQRHNVSTHRFMIQPAWHETTTFKIIMGSLLAAFVGFIFLLLRLRQNRRKIAEEEARTEKLQLEMKSIYARLNPHFVFNCLSSIQWLINKNDARQANQYLSEFGQLLRNSLTSISDDSNTLDKEIESMEKYLRLEKLRFKFDFSIEIDQAINPTEISLPSFLLQPLIENAVRHGVSGMDEEGKIRLIISRTVNDMIIRVEDNGKGIGKDRLYTGHGTDLTRQRINLINSSLKGKMISPIEVEHLSSGTVIQLTFKNWLNDHQSDTH